MLLDAVIKFNLQMTKIWNFALTCKHLRVGLSGHMVILPASPPVQGQFRARRAVTRAPGTLRAHGPASNLGESESWSLEGPASLVGLRGSSINLLWIQ